MCGAAYIHNTYIQTQPLVKNTYLSSRDPISYTPTNISNSIFYDYYTLSLYYRIREKVKIRMFVKGVPYCKVYSNTVDNTITINKYF